mgnify:CR=1 FL=1
MFIAQDGFFIFFWWNILITRCETMILFVGNYLNKRALGLRESSSNAVGSFLEFWLFGMFNRNEFLFLELGYKVQNGLIGDRSIESVLSVILLCRDNDSDLGFLLKSLEIRLHVLLGCHGFGFQGIQRVFLLRTLSHQQAQVGFFVSTDPLFLRILFER